MLMIALLTPPLFVMLLYSFYMLGIWGGMLFSFGLSSLLLGFFYLMSTVLEKK